MLRIARGPSVLFTNKAATILAQGAGLFTLQETVRGGINENASVHLQWRDVTPFIGPAGAYHFIWIRTSLCRPARITCLRR